MIRQLIVRPNGRLSTVCHPGAYLAPLAEGCHAATRSIRPGFQRRLRSTRQGDEQKVPLSGYYADILGTSPDTTSDAKSSTPSSQSPMAAAATVASNPAQAEKAEREARARVVFGTRLAGPERQRQLEAGSTMVAGVRIPPKPEEPDNCCMSGCVNCVWDRFRDELEEWAEASALARGKMAAENASTVGSGARPMEGVAANLQGQSSAIGGTPTHVAISMDDDGGGSETNWEGGADLDVGKRKNKKDDELYAGIPVGIREFMRTEKLLKQRHASATSSI